MRLPGEPYFLPAERRDTVDSRNNMADELSRGLLRRRGLRLRLFFGGIISGLAAGLAVAAYRFLIGETEGLRASLAAAVSASGLLLPYALWAGFLMALAGVLVLLGRWEPAARGSGIPHVKGVLLGCLRMRWARVLAVQIFGGALAIGAGLSLGHAGPAVQIGAAAAEGTSRAAGFRRLEERCLITGGAGAGLAAVFNAPLAGMLFAVEELHRHFSAAVLLPAMAASVSAAALIRFLFGDATIFHFTGIRPLSADHLPYVLLLAAVCGAAALPFNYGILHADRLFPRALRQNAFARLALPLAAAGLLTFLCPALTGGGDGLINALTLSAPAFPVLALLLCGKALFTFLSFGSGAPGGFFFPSLTVGALTGAAAGSLLIAAGLLPPEAMTNMIILSMAAFFSASVRAPITGTVLLLELTGDFQHLLPLAVASAAAYAVSGLLGGRPVYGELLRLRMAGKSGASPEYGPGRIAELAVSAGCPLDGRTVKDLPLPPRTAPAEILREGEYFVPDRDTVLRPGDLLYVVTQHADPEPFLRLQQPSLPEKKLRKNFMEK